jgi:hypothetical protein
MTGNYHEVMGRIAELERQKGLNVKRGEWDPKGSILVDRGLSIDDELVDIWVSKSGSSYRIGVPKTDKTPDLTCRKEKTKSFQEAYSIFGEMINSNVKR